MITVKQKENKERPECHQSDQVVAFVLFMRSLQGHLLCFKTIGLCISTCKGFCYYEREDQRSVSVNLQRENK